MKKTRTAALLVISMLGAATLSACADTSSTDAGSEPVVSTIPSTEPETAAAPVEQEATEQETTAAETECSDPAMDLAETQLGYWLRGGVIHAGDGFWMHLSDLDNQFDPCAELSWVVLKGAHGDHERPGGTGASMTHALVLFAGPDLVTDPVPMLSPTVESVDRLADDEIEVVFGHRGGVTAEGVTEFTSSTIRAGDGDVTVSGEAGTSGALDMSRAMPPGPATDRGYGNANFPPGQSPAERDTTRWPMHLIPWNA